MDWFTVLMIILFFVAPVIQQIMEAKKKAESESGGPTEGYPEDFQRVGVPYPDAAEGTRTVPTAGRESWSDGWGSWPGTEPTGSVDRAAEEVEVVVRRREPPERTPREDPRRAREMVLRDRSPEPVHPRPTTTAPLPVPARATLPATAVRKQVPAARPARTAARPAPVNRIHPLLVQLRGGRPEDLRDAIIAAEILSQPRGLRPIE